MCDHWGLTRWCYGIPEYLSNSYCICIHSPNPDGVYNFGKTNLDCFCSIIFSDNSIS